MVCGSCVENLAHRLVSHEQFRKKYNWIEALEHAAKGHERHEANQPKPIRFDGVRSVTEQQKRELPFDPDYFQNCITGGNCACYAVFHVCATDPDCVNTNTCACTCPAPPVPNSSYVSNTCVPLASGCTCLITLRCRTTDLCSCSCSGLCYYNCDLGYVWNPITFACDLIPTGQPLMDGFIFVDPA